MLYPEEIEWLKCRLEEAGTVLATGLDMPHPGVSEDPEDLLFEAVHVLGNGDPALVFARMYPVGGGVAGNPGLAFLRLQKASAGRGFCRPVPGPAEPPTAKAGLVQI